MPIDIDIAKVAKLARIALSDEDLAGYQEQCTGILEHAERVQSIDTDGVPPTAHPFPMVNSFRDDVVEPSLDRDEILAMAPDVENGYFRVPAILGDEEGEA